MQKNTFALLKKTLTPAILSLTTILFYLPTLWYDFIFDDFPTITKNIHIIKKGKMFDQLFANNRWLTRTMNKILYNFWQATPFYYRIITLSIHIISGILIFFFLLNVLSNLKKQSFLKANAYLISTLTSGLFLLHPVQTQTVPYITQMQLEGTVVLFTFAVLLLFTYATRAKNLLLKISLYIAAYSLTSLAAGTKEIIVVLPLLIVLSDWFLISQGNWRSFVKRIPIHVLFFAILFGSIINLNWHPTDYLPTSKIAIENNRGNILTASKQEKITPAPFFISQFQVMVHYIHIYFWPSNICFDYEMKIPPSFWHKDSLIPFLILLSILLIALILFIRDQGNLITFCIGWFFISVLPRASFYPSTELVCDYKTYIASLGILLFISMLVLITIQILYQTIEKALKFKIHFDHQIPFIILIILASGYSTKIRNNVWSSELLFWKDVVNKNPNKARGYNNYAVSLSEMGDKEGAIKNYEKSSALDPTYAEPVINLAFHYQIQGNKDIAMEYYKKALNLNEMHPEMYHNLGILNLQKNHISQAEFCFKTAVKLRPYYSRSHSSLAYVYQQQKNNEKAFYHYKQAIEGDFPNTEHHYQYASLGLKLGKLDEALKSFEHIKQINSNYKDSVFLLASGYYQKRNYAQAAKNFEIIYNQNPEQIIAAYNYAQSLMNLNEHKKAEPLFKKCLKDTEKFPYANLHHAKCLAAIGKKQEATNNLKDLMSKTTNVALLEGCKNLLREMA